MSKKLGFALGVAASTVYISDPRETMPGLFVFVVEERGRVIQMGSLIIETQKQHDTAAAASIAFDGSQSLGPIKRLLSCLLLLLLHTWERGSRGRSELLPHSFVDS